MFVVQIINVFDVGLFGHVKRLARLFKLLHLFRPLLLKLGSFLS